MGRETHDPHRMHRRGRLARRLRLGGFVALLMLLVAVPALAAVGPSSSTSYVFATSDAQGALGLWKNTPQIVSIVASPSVDATVTAHFSSNNGVSWTTHSADDTHTATFPFTVALQGSHAIKFYASDTSGGPGELMHSPGFVNIDTADPIFTTVSGLEATSTQTLAAGWTKDTSRIVSLVATDVVPPGVLATSGVKELVRRINTGSEETSASPSWTFTLTKGAGGVAEGSNTVVYKARDWAGNVITGTGYFNVDTVAPTTAVSPALAASPTTGWRNAPVTVSLIATDAASGVPTAGTSYRLDDGNLAVYSVPFAMNAEGSTKLTWRSIDRAGNVEATSTAYANIDTGIPTVSVKTSPSRNSGWYNKNVVVTLTGVDTLSGVAMTQYRLQADPPLSWIDATGNAFTVLAGDNAVEKFDYQAVDNAGNVSVAAGITLKMDSIKPKTFGKDATVKLGKSVAVKYKITDNLSPKAQAVMIKIKNSSGKTVKTQSFSNTKNVNTWLSYSWKPKAKGTYTYYVYAKDLAGNAQQSANGGKIKVK